MLLRLKLPADNQLLRNLLLGALMLGATLCSEVIPESVVLDAFVKELRAKVPEYSDKQISVNLNLKQYQKQLFVITTDNWSVAVILPKKEEISSITYAKVIIREGLNITETLRLKFNLSIYDEVFYAKSPLPKGSLAEQGLFYAKSTDLMKLSQKVIDKNFYFSDKYFICDVKQDQLMYAWMVAQKPSVLVGEIISVSFYADGVVLNLPARVLQQGCVGDKILVQLTNGSRKTFKALIVSAGKYEVRL